MTVEPVIELGYERDTLGVGGNPWRWWFYVLIPGSRNKRARQGVVDRGFRFARGGRVETEDDCRYALQDARWQAGRELRLWAHQPSHALGPAGQLVPLDELEADERMLGT